MESIKKKVLSDLINKMNGRMGDKLKGKSPKFMKVETNDPEMAEEVIENVMPNMEHKPNMENEDDEQRLMDMYKNLK